MYFSWIWFFWTIIIGINVSVLRYRWFPIFLSISLYIYLHRFTDWPAELKSKEQMLLMYTELPHWNQDTTGKGTHWILYSHPSSLYTSRLESTCFFEQIGIKMRNYLKSKRQIVSLHLVAKTRMKNSLQWCVLFYNVQVMKLHTSLTRQIQMSCFKSTRAVGSIAVRKVSWTTHMKLYTHLRKTVSHETCSVTEIYTTMHACTLISASELTDFHKTLYAYYATAGYCNAVHFKFVMPAITNQPNY